MIDVDKLGASFWKKVMMKGLGLFLAVNFVFGFFNPIRTLESISAYNLLFPGRMRLPFGERPEQAYNLSLYSLEAMFASHEITGKKPANEYRIILIGDSSVWGYLLKPEETLAASINSANLQTGKNRVMRAYNLGYPTMSLAKDLLILSYAMRYEPDLIIWSVTLESFPTQKQLESPIVQNNPSPVRDLIDQYSLMIDPADPRFTRGNFLDATLIGQRRALADMFRLQLYGVMWAASGIDQFYPQVYDPPQEDLDPDETFQGFHPPVLNPADLSFDVLDAGHTMAGIIPVIFVNEPIYISHGENSELRYNFFYPRWAYDQYRQIFTHRCQEYHWHCLDEWNLVPGAEFTNSAIHLTPYGTGLFASSIEKAILQLIQP